MTKKNKSAGQDNEQQNELSELIGAIADMATIITDVQSKQISQSARYLAAAIFAASATSKTTVAFSNDDMVKLGVEMEQDFFGSYHGIDAESAINTDVFNEDAENATDNIVDAASADTTLEPEDLSTGENGSEPSNPDS